MNDWCLKCNRPSVDCVGHIRGERPPVDVVDRLYPKTARQLPIPELSAIEVDRIRQRERYYSKINARKRKRANKRRNGK